MSTTQHSQLATIVASMLIENTGSHFLDSGGTPSYDADGNYISSSGGYGRAHERNRARAGDDPVAAFEAEKQSWWNWPCVYPNANFRKGKALTDYRAELNPTHSVYHWLVEMALADYNEEMDKALTEFGNSDDYKDEGWLTIMEAFPEHWARLTARRDAIEEYEHHASGVYEDEPRDQVIEDLTESYYHKPGGLYGDGRGFIVNTYNGEDCLSQTLQFLYFEHDHSAYCLLQIHGGADVRGGYTAPRAFDLGGMHDETAILDNARASCGCTECDARWYSDDAGCNWYNDEYLPRLNDIPAIEGNRAEAGVRCLEVAGPSHTRIVIVEGPDYAPSNTVMCPICGKGELMPWFY